MSSSASPWVWNEQYRKYYRQEYIDGDWETIWQGEEQTQPTISPSSQVLSTTHPQIQQVPTQTSNETRQRIDSGTSSTQDEIDDLIQRVTSNASMSSAPSHHSSASSPSTSTSYYAGGQWRQLPQQRSYHPTQPSNVQVPSWSHSTIPSAPQQQPVSPYYATTNATAGAANPGNEGYFEQTAAQAPTNLVVPPSEGGPEQSPLPLISGTQGNSESLDPSYNVKRKSFFEVGRTFAVLFHEGVGSTAPTDHNDSVSLVRFGEHVHSQIRRFVVVKSRREFCYACPVYTYRNQGTLKPGVEPSEHAIIYTTGKSPTLLPNEIGIVKQSIAVDPVDPYNPQSSGHPLHDTSRINFGISHAIQYNVKVKDMGMVSYKDLNRLRSYWQYELGKR